MKKYKVKENSLYAPRGAVYVESTTQRGVWVCCSSHKFQPWTACFNADPKDYPTIFEPIEEKTPEERVADWISISFATMPYAEQAQKLIAAGLDVDKLEGVK